MRGSDNSKSVARRTSELAAGAARISGLLPATAVGALVMLSACTAQRQDIEAGKGEPLSAHLGAESFADSDLKLDMPPPAVQRKAEGDDTVQDGGGRTDPSRADHQIVRYIGTDSSKWRPGPSELDYSDLYTRVELYADAGATGVGDGTQSARPLRDYASENRDWLSRLLASETDTVTTLANIEVRDPQLSIAVPLFSISHASGRDLGNTWATNFTSSNIDSPLFRLGPNTGLTIHLNTKVSSDLKSQGASLVVGAVQKAVQIAAPQSTLLTTLSNAEIANTASAIDTAISGLFSRDISEDIQLGRLADSWGQDASFTLYGCAPFVHDEGLAAKASGGGGGSRQGAVTAQNGNCAKSIDLDGGYNIPVGVWTIRLACPHVSAFSSRDICNGATPGQKPPAPPATPEEFAKVTKADQMQVLTTASDAQILQFNLSSQINIQTFVQSQGWYTGFTSAKTTARTSPDYAAFCSGAILGMEAGGLNQFDSALALRAVIRQIPAVAALRENFAAGKTGAGCIKQFQDATGSASISL
jgi:hypothetical protein